MGSSNGPWPPPLDRACTHLPPCKTNEAAMLLPPCVAESAAGAGPRPRPPQEGQAPAAAAGLAGADVAGEAAELRQHCVVLEQLLDVSAGWPPTD